MSTSGVVIHDTELGCQSHNPHEIHCSEWELCVLFALCFQEHIPGIKQYLLACEEKHLYTKQIK